MQRASIATCARAPATTPHFEPPRELFAMAVTPIAEPEVHQP
ncbi:MAG TPA: hypothetical protein VFS58_13640 [Steroidobacteraceae bacterium]|nr:hypothetical protein [Steroidobacteraceae bacterium]